MEPIQLVIYVLMILVLSYMSYSDFKTRRVPLYLQGILLFLMICFRRYEYRFITKFMGISLFIVFVIGVFFMYRQKMGGADFLLLLLITFFFGDLVSLLKVLIIANINLLAYSKIKGVSLKEKVPYVPFLAFGFLFISYLSYFQ